MTSRYAFVFPSLKNIKQFLYRPGQALKFTGAYGFYGARGGAVG
jgi:hypothetical protein